MSSHHPAIAPRRLPPASPSASPPRGGPSPQRVRPRPDRARPNAPESTRIGSGGTVQEYVEDCQVCCRPWRVTVRYAEDGTAEVFTEPLEGGNAGVTTPVGGLILHRTGPPCG